MDAPTAVLNATMVVLHVRDPVLEVAAGVVAQQHARVGAKHFAQQLVAYNVQRNLIDNNDNR